MLVLPSNSFPQMEQVIFMHVGLLPSRYNLVYVAPDAGLLSLAFSASLSRERSSASSCRSDGYASWMVVLAPASGGQTKIAISMSEVLSRLRCYFSVTMVSTDGFLDDG